LAKPGFRPESSAGSHPNHFGTEILDIIEEQTGRAAKRLAELTGHEACTVHRLLELQPGGEAKYDRDNPSLTPTWSWSMKTSMMDVILANKLIKAIPQVAHVLLGRRRRSAPLGRRRRGSARPARCRQHPAGAPHPDIPPSPAVGHHRQRSLHQPRPQSALAPATPPRLAPTDSD
jgi:hypothetical protein